MCYICVTPGKKMRRYYNISCLFLNLFGWIFVIVIMHTDVPTVGFALALFVVVFERHEGERRRWLRALCKRQQYFVRTYLHG